jgi:hypothetical protein
MHLRAFLMCLMLAAPVAGGCAERWVPNTPEKATFADDDRAYETVLSFLRSEGYSIEQKDDERRFIRARARLDGDMVLEPTAGGFGPPRAVERVSFFNFQVKDGGEVQVKVTGYHVRDNGTVMHRDLRAEFDALMQRLREGG